MAHAEDLGIPADEVITDEIIASVGEPVRYESVEANNSGDRALRKQYGPCELIPTNVHVRTRTGDGDARIIGFKPVTRCSQRVESIKHESKLKYQYFNWWLDAPLKKGVPTISQNRGQAKLEQKNVEFQCNGLVETNFIGYTKGTIVANGKTYYAQVSTDLFREACRV